MSRSMTANPPTVKANAEGDRRRLMAAGEGKITPTGHYSAISASRVREEARIFSGTLRLGASRHWSKGLKRTIISTLGIKISTRVLSLAGLTHLCG